MSTPDLPPLDEARLKALLVETSVVSRLVRTDATDSTNTALVADAESPDFAAEWPHFSVLTAEQQTAGRGRLGRGWSSPAGSSLSTSIVLRPGIPSPQWPWLSLLAGAALAQVLRRGLELEAAVKWPNDVLIAGRKCAGILAVVPPAVVAGSRRGTEPDCVIVGVGVNVLQKETQIPTARSTSVLLERARAGLPAPVPGTDEAVALRTTLLIDWLSRFSELMSAAENVGDISVVRDEVRTVTGTIGQQVRLELPGGTAVRGQAVGVEDDGGLSIEVSGRRRTPLDPEHGGGDESLWEQVRDVRETFTVADVVHLRDNTA